MRNQAYKLKLSNKRRILNIFNVSLLKFNTIKKRQIKELTYQLKLKIDINDNKSINKYNIKTI